MLNPANQANNLVNNPNPNPNPVNPPNPPNPLPQQLMVTVRATVARTAASGAKTRRFGHDFSSGHCMDWRESL